jgi:antirestriction protein
MTTTNDTPRIFVSILADYNNGEQRGEWIDATDADTMRDEIARILRTSKYPNVTVPCPDCDHWRKSDDTAPCLECNDTGKVPSAEEYAIHDYDGFYDLSRTLGEYPNLDDVAHAGSMIQEHGEPWALWADNIGDVTLTEDDFQDAYCGEYDDENSYAESYIDDTGMLSEVAENIACYFDYDAFARDLFLDGYTFERGTDGQGYVFRSC